MSKLDTDRMGGGTDLDVAAQQQRRRLEGAGCTEIFFDIQRGTDDDRPRFEELMKRVKSKQCDRVTITRDDRITRNVSMTLQILEVFHKSKVELVVLDEGGRPLDLDNPYEWKRRMTAGVDAQFEVRMLGLRVRKGYEDLRSQRKANAAMPFGFQRTKEGFYAAHPEQYEAARWMIETLIEKIKLAQESAQDEKKQRVYAGCVFQSCKAFNNKYEANWDHSRFRRWLINPVLRGHTPRFVNMVTGEASSVDFDTHPDLALISPSEDELISEMLRVTGQYRGVNQKAKLYPLGGGLCRCDRCGHPMTVTAKNLKNRGGLGNWYLVCADSGSYNREVRCKNLHAIPYPWVEEKVVAKLCEAAELISEGAMTPEGEEESREVQDLRRQLVDLQRIPNKSPIIVKAIADMENQIAIAQGDAESEDGERSFSEDLLRACGETAANPDYWYGLNDEDKRTLYHALVREIRIDGAKRQGSRFVDYSVEVSLVFL